MAALDRDAGLPTLPREVERSVMRITRKHGTLRETVRQAERGLLAEALRDQNGNRTRAAVALGISRTLVHKKLLSLGMRPAAAVRARQAATPDRGSGLPLAPEIKKTVIRIARKNGTLAQMLQQIERWLIAEALSAHGGNKTKTATAIGITREALHKKLRKLGLRPAPRKIERTVTRVAQKQPTLGETLRQVKRWRIANALRTHSNRTKAAAALGLGRVALYHTMWKLGMRPAAFPRPTSRRTVRRRSRR